MRKKATYTIRDVAAFKEALLDWAGRFTEVVWLDSNQHQDQYSSFEAVLAVDPLTSIRADTHNAFDALRAYQKTTQDWIFGYLSYDLKNDIEALSSDNADGLNFPELYFFQPKKLIRIKGNKVDFLYLNGVAEDMETDFSEISELKVADMESDNGPEAAKIKLRIFKDEYFKRVSRLLHHIHRGDVYEANFCQEFYVEALEIKPYATYRRLNAISRPPFAAFMRLDDKYLLSASPERYLKKMGDTLISQPIKGTARRAKDKEEDERLKKALETDTKERAENIMIVDLVRNDLSKNANKGSVRVAELCKVYSFPQVHQMISTITAEVSQAIDPVQLIRESFPMGSMTGAPKVSAMKIIEALEASKRSLYSGAVGYFTPEGDFDFNVVIRSILYNATRKYVSYSVGSAITAKAAPDREYEECLIKAKAMREVLER
ncbi:anthranilate synthase component I family protein [Spongiimicrobium sp. 2-473A-2-J]|uniref:anthranilate synthase component I family protein n=1 Tax=Eudoraea algarum TaxID=3417568 RepID=UPI003D366DC6